MSSSGRSASSQREQNVLEQQRKLAALLKRPAAKPTTHTKPTARRPAKAGVLNTKASLKKGEVVVVPKNSLATGGPKGSEVLKRPARPTLKRPNTSATSVIAAARAKASSSEADASLQKGTSRAGPVAPEGLNAAERTLRLKRKVKPAGDPTSSRLAGLVQSVASNSGSANDDSFLSSAFGTNISPDDFWKNIRDWDIVKDLAQPGSVSSGTKPIPETFISFRHYVALWAPLCLAETRAQLLSEASTEFSQVQQGARFVLVDVDTTWKGGGRKERSVHSDLTDMDSCNVQLKTKDRRSSGSQFFAHDIFCLVRVESRDAMEMLLKGKEVDSDSDTLRNCCLIGHNEVQRKEINGLILKVSKRKWALVGRPKMYLFRIGGNITALREFTAMCRVETTPLKRYLLGHHLESVQKKDKANLPSAEPAQNIRKEALLRKMGGTQALGKGFTEFARRKFNNSQLMAISASAQGYGDGGFTLIKGPPGTGKTTTLVAVLNSLHIRQYNKYYEEVRRIAAMQTGNRQAALDAARKAKPRLLVCAPSNAAVDNIILKIMEDGFVDGSGQRYNPSMIRVGVGQSSAVGSISLETKINQILADLDIGQLESSIAGFRMELQRITADIASLRRRCHALGSASPWPLGQNWEIRVEEETFDSTGRVYFVNHKDHTTTYEVPPPPEPGEVQYPARSMPEYRAFMQRIVKSVESYFTVKTNLERNVIVKGSLDNGANHFAVRQSLESHVLNSVHMVMTTLGTAGNRIFESADRFEVVVVDEAAQSVEPATLSALQLGSRHCVLVGDPQQLPATIFNVSGRITKYDRSLFQRLEEAGEPVHMLDEQYRMHPKISHFPRHIFYGGNLRDGPNVTKLGYGNPLLGLIMSRVPNFQPFSILDMDSREERGGTSLSNTTEAHLAVHLYSSLVKVTQGIAKQSRVALITPYSQQANLLRRVFRDHLGDDFARFVEVNTVDAFQGREANIVIFSAVRAAGSHGIGFLSDVRRMNVALTRAKHFMFVIARCQSVVVNPYWKDLVDHARETRAVLRVPILGESPPQFGDITSWNIAPAGPTTGRIQEPPSKKPVDPRRAKNQG